jgi:hypothetical protein
VLREKLVFRAEVKLVPEGTLPRFEMKARLVRTLYEEEQKQEPHATAEVITGSMKKLTFASFMLSTFLLAGRVR